MRTTAAGLQMTFNLYRCHSKVGHLYVCLIVEEQIFRFKVTMTGESEWMEKQLVFLFKCRSEISVIIAVVFAGIPRMNL